MLLARLIALVLSLLLLAAAEAEEPSLVDAQPAPDSAPVTIDGVELFRVSGSASFPSSERARNVTARIIAAADDPGIAPAAVVTQPGEGRIDIVAGSRHLVAVVATDASLEGVALTDAALLRAVRIREALTRYRADRSTESIAQALLATTLAAAIAVLLLLAGIRGFRLAFDTLERRYRSRVQSLTIQSFEVVRADSIWRGMKSVLGTLRILFIVAIVYALCAFSLREFPATRGVAEQLVQFVVEPLQSIGMAVLRYLPKLAFLVVLVVIIRYVLKLLGLFFDAVHAGRVPLRSFDAGHSSAIGRSESRRSIRP